MTISLWILLRMRNVSNNICRENQNTHFTFRNFFLKSYNLWDNVEKRGGVREAANNTAHALCMLDKQDYSPAPVYPHSHPPTRTHAKRHLHSPARARTHTDKSVILTAPPRQQWFGTRLNVNVIRAVPVCLLLISTDCVSAFCQHCVVLCINSTRFIVVLNLYFTVQLMNLQPLKFQIFLRPSLSCDS